MGKIDGLEEGTSYINESACDESKNDDKKNILEHESPFLLFVNNICSLFHGSIPPVLILHSLGHPDKLGGWQSTGRSLSEKLLDWYAQCRHQARGEDRLPAIDAQGLVTVAFQHQHLNGARFGIDYPVFRYTRCRVSLIFVIAIICGSARRGHFYDKIGRANEAIFGNTMKVLSKNNHHVGLHYSIRRELHIKRGYDHFSQASHFDMCAQV